ncbi:MAG: helix-turn-helix domain-containing protein [Gammaproteobacteria bacterium]|nr:helix-turn-helix domain-containing protein [Gammaproteobacteria bacterium]
MHVQAPESPFRFSLRLHVYPSSQQRHGIGERTIRGYLQRYRQRGPRALLFYRPRPASPRVHDAALRARLLELIDELPTRSVPQLRKLIKADDKLGARIARISDRTLYRFLADHGLTKRARFLMLADDGRTSFRAFEAPTPWPWSLTR